MPRIETIAADTPFGERLVAGFGYPLRGAGLATCTALTLAHYAGFLPAVGTLACLLHTAHGYADPPDVGSEGNGASGWGLTAIHLLLVALCVLAVVFFPRALWPVLVVAALALPAVDMSLAFDGNLALALNPLNWIRVVNTFGPVYLVPVAINLLLGLLIVLASLGSHLLPRFLALPLFAFASTYLIVLAFHLMGALIHLHHERLGLVPE